MKLSRKYSANAEALWDACRSGETAHLARLISKNKFPVNKNLSGELPNHLPLVEAINHHSMPVVKLLLDHGADPNLTFGEALLTKAVKTGNFELVKLLIDRGTDITITNFQALRMSLKPRNRGRNQQVQDLLLNLATRFANDRTAGVKKQKAGKCAQMIKAVFKSDAAKVDELLKLGGYATYAGSLDDNRPALLAVKRGDHEVVKVFVEAGADLTRIYFEAAEKGHLATVKLCLDQPGFNPDCRSNFLHNQTVLHKACLYSQLEVVKLLVGKYKLKLDESDRYGRTPLQNIRKENLRTILAAFPELDVKVPRDVVINHCDTYAILLEHGTYSIKDLQSYEWHDCEFAEESFSWANRKPQGPSICYAILYLQKLMLVDEDYVKRILIHMMNLDIKELLDFEFFCKKECEDELVKMSSIRISQGTTSVKGKSLQDLFYLSPNEAARYCRNQILLKIYEENSQDFSKFLPHYGFDLNRQLRRGEIRRDRLESAMELLCFALGTGLPEDFAELVFGNLSNTKLDQFSLKSTEDSV